jgi:hypothetical protein
MDFFKREQGRLVGEIIRSSAPASGAEPHRRSVLDLIPIPPSALTPPSISMSTISRRFTLDTQSQPRLHFLQQGRVLSVFGSKEMVSDGLAEGVRGMS